MVFVVHLSRVGAVFRVYELDGAETVHNRKERNVDCGEYGQGLTIFSQTARPTVSRQNDVGMS